MRTPQIIDGFPAFAPELARSGGGYDESLFATMAALEAGNFWFTSRNKLITWAIRTYAPAPTSIMEIGCGTGFVLSGIGAAFPRADLVGSEIFVAGLDFTQRRLPDAELIQMDARDIPFASRFDVVGAFDVLEHIEEDKKALQEVWKSLKPGGLMVVSVPQHRWLWSPADECAHHVRRYTARELENKVVAADFEVLRATSFVTFLLPLMVVSRWKDRRRPDRYDPVKEFELPAVANRLFGIVLGLERMLIRWGVNLPAGGSRLLVARRPLDR